MGEQHIGARSWKDSMIIRRGHSRLEEKPLPRNTKTCPASNAEDQSLARKHPRPPPRAQRPAAGGLTPGATRYGWPGCRITHLCTVRLAFVDDTEDEAARLASGRCSWRGRWQRMRPRRMGTAPEKMRLAGLVLTAAPAKPAESCLSARQEECQTASLRACVTAQHRLCLCLCLCQLSRRVCDASCDSLAPSCPPEAPAGCCQYESWAAAMCRRVR